MAYPVCDVLTNYQANRKQEMRETEGGNGVISKFGDATEPCEKPEELVVRRADVPTGPHRALRKGLIEDVF
ncbi:MAG: hypothetical protein H0U72_06180 [Nitrosospira sp.]|nr:hypothetical protein [Nitrosospira sp.]